MTEMVQRETKTQADFDHQRANGWPDFHPEDYCHRCGGPNMTWAAPQEVWNPVMRPEGPDTENWLWNEIVCPPCFSEMAAKNVASGVIWELRIHPVKHRGAKDFQAASDLYEEDL